MKNRRSKEVRLAGSRRPPEHHGMKLPQLHRLPQGFTCTQQMKLTDKFIEIARPHTVRQGPEFTDLADFAHGELPIISVSGGSSSLNRP